LDKPDITYYLCEEDVVPVGYIKLIANMPYVGLEGNCIELEKIYVQQNYFGKHAGQLLMDKAIEHAIQNNFHYLFLGVWKENSRAVKFYEKNGFTVFSERSFQLGERLCEDYMMCLQIK
jgi:ribosomal protein S18 acetylase RimI-like enzyme